MTFLVDWALESNIYYIYLLTQSHVDSNAGSCGFSLWGFTVLVGLPGSGAIGGCESGLFVCLLKAYSPANRTGSPQGFSQFQILHMSHKKAFISFNIQNTIHTHTHTKFIFLNTKNSIFGIALVYSSNTVGTCWYRISISLQKHVKKNHQTVSNFSLSQS